MGGNVEDESEPQMATMLALREAVQELGHEGHFFANGQPQCPFLIQARLPKHVDVLVVNGKHQASNSTSELLEAVGGRERLLSLTRRFYSKMFRDKHLSLFVEETGDPHADRLA